MCMVSDGLDVRGAALQLGPLPDADVSPAAFDTPAAGDEAEEQRVMIGEAERVSP